MRSLTLRFTNVSFLDKASTITMFKLIWNSYSLSFPLWILLTSPSFCLTVGPSTWPANSALYHLLFTRQYRFPHFKSSINCMLLLPRFGAVPFGAVLWRQFLLTMCPVQSAFLRRTVRSSFPHPIFLRLIHFISCLSTLFSLSFSVPNLSTYLFYIFP